VNFNTPFGEFNLERLPKTKTGSLRAWDAADELLLKHLHHNDDLTEQKDKKKPVLIINDAFGGLSCPLNQLSIHCWSDSFVAHDAIRRNCHQNKIMPPGQFIPASQSLQQQYDLVLIKVPKTLSLLEDQLYRLKPHIHTDTTLIACGMAKHIHRTTLTLFENIIGDTHTSRATKKARLIFTRNTQPKILPSPYPKTVHDGGLQLSLNNYANVFANNQIDQGSRFFIEHFGLCPKADRILDLGCGNGALGIMMKRLQPKAQIDFVDESYLALKSAEENWNRNGFMPDDGRFIVSNCLEQYQGEKSHLILCNPPFHQGHHIGDQTAWTMFKQSKEQLAINGELWVIGNRHLAYHNKLKRLFGNCTTVASNKKFVVLVAKKVKN